MKTVLVGLVIFALSGRLAWSASNTDLIIELLDRATPVDAETYHTMLKNLAVAEDTSGMQQYLYSAYWERAPVVFHTSSSNPLIGVMRTNSEVDAEKIFNRGLMFASSGFSPHGGLREHGEWSASRKVVEFGYPRILMNFGDVLVAFQDYAPMPDSEKLLLIAEFEKGVQEWRKRSAEHTEPRPGQSPNANFTVPVPADQDVAPKVNGASDAPTDEASSSSPGSRMAILTAVLAVACLLLAWAEYKRRNSRPK